MKSPISTMNAAVWHRSGHPIEVEPLELLDLGDEDVLVRVGAANVSFSDHITVGSTELDGPGALPQVLGHAAVGVVVAVGSAVHRVAVGDRVIATSTPQCGECWFCLRDAAQHCAELRLVGPPHARRADGTAVIPSGSVGAFAEFAVAPQLQLTVVRTTVTDAELALVANPLGVGVGAALRTAPVEAGSVAVAVGCGPCGLAYVQAARLAGAGTIVAIDPIADRRAMALRLGATIAIDPAEQDPVAAVHEIGGDHGGLQGAGGDYVFESAADPRAIEQAWQMTRAAGHLVLSSVPVDMTATVTFPAVPFALFGKTVHSCQYGSLDIRRDLPWIVGLIERGQLDAQALLTHEYGLDEVDAAIAAVGRREVLGATVIPVARPSEPTPVEREPTAARTTPRREAA